jgi:Na+-translocating ferredoxin:NAD+ oxidoreductase RnfC subunit
VITTTIRSEKIKKKETTQQIKNKRIILKRNKKINDEHDKYVKQQKKEAENNRDEFDEMNALSKLNQSKKFHDFDDE